MKFYLNVNKQKKSDKSPDWWGYVKDDAGNQTHKVSAWEGNNSNGRYLSVIVDPIVQDDKFPLANHPDDGLPF